MGRPQYSRPCDKERRLRSYRFVPFCFLIQTIMVGLLACGCQRHQVGGGHEGRLSETDKAAPIVPTDVVKPLAEFNRGAALLEQYQYARAAEKFQSVLTAFPAWTAARFNLGLALLNLPDAPTPSIVPKPSSSALSPWNPIIVGPTSVWACSTSTRGISTRPWTISARSTGVIPTTRLLVSPTRRLSASWIGTPRHCGCWKR